MIQTKHFRVGHVIFDDRYAPLLIGTFFGEMDLESARWFESVHTEAVLRQVALGRKVVSINDSTQSVHPSPEVRQFWAHSTHDAPEESKRAMLGTFVVIQSAVLRGAMTAIGWLSEEARAIETFKTIEDAIEEAKRRLGGAGISVAPPIPYRLPDARE